MWQQDDHLIASSSNKRENPCPLCPNGSLGFVSFDSNWLSLGPIPEPILKKWGLELGLYMIQVHPNHMFSQEKLENMALKKGNAVPVKEQQMSTTVRKKRHKDKDSTK